MNDTNRAVNRVVLMVAGVLLLAAGAGALAAMAWPAAGDAWAAGGAAAIEWMRRAHDATRVSEATTLSWFVLALLAALLLVVVFALVVVARLGGGRSGSVARFEPGEGAQGAVTIRQGFASDAIARSLDGDRDILACRVDTRAVAGEDVLHVSVTPRRGTSPAAVASAVTALLDSLEVLTGRDAPALVSIRSGIRSRLAGDRPRVT
ncbi:hypothetical protein [Microbacterium indicum]|uniref:hypothetical protein n=1 Tax=Microbacterium indicum TaxID=358100 RepID=UPI00048ABBC1|nr:hypothetical protein [Microbacterium indicum]